MSEKVQLGQPHEDSGLTWPPIHRELAEFLNAHFPDRCPPLAMPDREIWYHAGERGLVNRILEAYRRQTDRR